jgi:hypothetical protein
MEFHEKFHGKFQGKIFHEISWENFHEKKIRQMSMKNFMNMEFHGISWN